MTRFGMFFWRYPRRHTAAAAAVLKALSSDDNEPLIADDGTMLEVYDG